MIQRIQTLWLLFASVTLGFMFFYPVVYFGNGGDVMIYDFESLNAAGVKGLIQTGYIISSLTGLAAFLSFITIFLFKNRTLQMRLCVLTSLIIVFDIVLIVIFSFNKFESPYATAGLSSVLPFVGFIFVLTARRAIRRDDLLVKAADRIR